MTFYTNVLQYGNSLLVREVDSNGQRIKKRVQYQPTLFDLITTKDARSTLLINRDTLTRFRVSVNPHRKFVLSNWSPRGDKNDEPDGKETSSGHLRKAT